MRPFFGAQKRKSEFFRKKYCFFGRVMVLYQSRHDATEYGRLAQLVEHLLDVQEVTGSSPVPSTTKIPSQMTRDFLHGWDRTRTARPRRRRGKQQPSGLLFSAWFPIFRNVYQGCANPILYEKGFGYVFCLQEVLRKGCSAHKPECERMRR